MTEPHFNQLTPAEAEALALLSEECAEVVQVIGKIQRHGLHSHNPDDPAKGSNLALLHKELGDVLAAIEIGERIGMLGAVPIAFCRTAKLLNIGKWLHHIRLDDPEVAP